MKLRILLLTICLFITGCQFDRPFYHTRDAANLSKEAISSGVIKKKEQDNIQGYALVKDQPNTLIAFGHKYDYVLTMPDELKNIFRSSFLAKSYLNTYDGRFYEKNGEFNITFSLKIPESKLSTREGVEAKKLGFNLEHDSLNKENVYKWRGDLIGQLYKANEKNLEILAKQPYQYHLSFTAYRPRDMADKAFIVAFTPVYLASALTLDVLEWGSIAVLYTLGTPFIVADKLTERSSASGQPQPKEN